MLEFDLMNSFHLHGGMFEYYPAGTGTNPVFKTDVVELGQGDRGIWNSITKTLDDTCFMHM